MVCSKDVCKIPQDKHIFMEYFNPLTVHRMSNFDGIKWFKKYFTKISPYPQKYHM